MKTKTSLLYEIDTPVYLNKLSDEYQHPISLSTIPDEELQKLVDLGVNTVWLMGIWERSPRSVAIGQSDEKLMAAFHEVLPDLEQQDFIGSAYSVRDYKVNQAYGGESELAIFREKLKSLGISLILDFVPNHTAPDHSWVSERPDYYIHGNSEDLNNHPESFIDCEGTILANGRDPFFPAWSDVVQLNAFAAGYRLQAINTIRSIAEICDGVRCDMAMLMTNDIFAKTWGDRAGEKSHIEFWESVIPGVRNHYPDFVFIAEAYWNTEQQLINQGFDYCYDKQTHDLLFESKPTELKAHLKKTADIQPKLMEFIENHDEERAAKHYSEAQEMAAATIIYTLPGLHLLHDGQLEGYKVRIPVHLGRGPKEPTNTILTDFYGQLFQIINRWKLEDGDWSLVDVTNESAVVFAWHKDDSKHLAVINYADNESNISIELGLDQPAEFFDESTGEKHLASTNPEDKIELNLSAKPWQAYLLSES